MNDSIGEFFQWVVKHKYLFVTIAFLLMIVFLDENNLLKHIQNQREITELKTEIEELQEQHDIVVRKLGELDKDVDVLEKVAREKYGMHLEDEEIFIIED
ncbi:MAG: septum formation initiator family protein [Bacteroidaceae bacterium]|nr:septum formation initiator family protein [Bacteroidaceae bacterium]